MIWKAKFRYCTLFWPKYCAASGVAPASATAATAAAIRRMGIILSTRRRACPRRAPGHRPTAARAGKLPQLGVEHVYYEVHVVEQHPPPLRQPFHMMWRDPVRRQRCHQMVRDPPHVGVGRSRNDYEIVRGGAESPEVQYQRVDRFAVEQRLGDELQRRLRVHDGPLDRTAASPRAPTPASHSAALVRLFRPGRASPPGWLLLHHAHPDLGPDVGVDLDPDLEVAQLADRLGEVHLALVDVDPELLELALDVARRDRAVQLVLLADFDGEGEMHVGELRRLGFGGALLGRALPRDALGFVRDLLLIGLRGGVGESLRQEIVARVPVLHLDDVARGPEMLHIFSQNDLHRVLSLTV